MFRTITASKPFLFLYPLFSAVGYGALSAGIARAVQRDWVDWSLVWGWGLIMGGIAWTYTRMWAEARYTEEERHIMELEGVKTEATFNRTPDGFTALANTAPLAFQPNMVFLPYENGFRASLHITPNQLRIFQERIERNLMRLPINGVEGISSTEMKAVRREVVGADLARDKGNNVIEWTPEGAVKILTASPAPIVQRGKRV